jgi:hypothetical protein
MFYFIVIYVNVIIITNYLLVDMFINDKYVFRLASVFVITVVLTGCIFIVLLFIYLFICPSVFLLWPHSVLLMHLLGTCNIFSHSES